MRVNLSVRAVIIKACITGELTRKDLKSMILRATGFGGLHNLSITALMEKN